MVYKHIQRYKVVSNGCLEVTVYSIIENTVEQCTDLYGLLVVKWLALIVIHRSLVLLVSLLIDRDTILHCSVDYRAKL